MNSPEEKTISEVEIPTEIAILPLRDIVIFPAMIAPLKVGRKGSIKLVDEASVGRRVIGLFAQKEPDKESLQPEDVYKVGTGGYIIRMLKMPDGSVHLIVQGLARLKTVDFTRVEPYLKARVDKIIEEEKKDLETEALVRNTLTLFEKVVSLSPLLPQEIYITAMNIESPGKLADFIASNLNINLQEKQGILETFSPKERLQKITVFLNRELEILELGSKIQSDARTRMDKAQREYFLRQQLEAIRRELGEEDERAREIKELREKIKEAKMPPEVEKVAFKELGRIEQMPPHAAEYTVSRTYLDWLVSLPWSKSTEDNLDINRARKILDEDHYNLEKVKTRMIEYLAVRKLKEDMKGPILCFVGPPGTGKTSLGRSIARALGRKFVRISLGGVRDEAEIRGHRRTYVGALPGRIIQGIRQAGFNNPVFMMDEVDKIGADFRGDPAAALLEVLDPEQNNAFSDHYLEVPFDLSKVMFITTANILDTIPPALRDRMEVLELPGYVEEEKVKIAQNFLIPRQLREHGITPENLVFEEGAIQRIIREYTKEAGLRNLEREIASICRKVASKIAGGEKGKFVIKDQDVPEYLGPIKYFSEVTTRTSQPGVATGLAWTPSGGEVLFVESVMMRGKKSLTLTGQLGEVMRESAQAALSYIRSRAKELSIPDDFFEKNDIHIHVPQGAIPKDGPSAGITIATSLASLLTGRKVKSEVAMTGEITLQGQVLPVGGIKEKVLAAKRSGIKTIILPKKNQKDLQEIPQHIIKDLHFIFVENMDEVLKSALEEKRLQRSG